MHPSLSLLAVAAGFALANPASAIDDAGLAAAVEQRLAGDRTGACFAAAVVEPGKVSRAFVCADPKDVGRIGPDAAFEIGSVSKTMTSVLLAGLIEQGKGSLDDPLADWLPEGTAVPTFEGQPILLRHVVTHRAGLPALPTGVAMPDPSDPYATIDSKMLLAALERTTLTRAPGAAFEYSNFASMLLSYAVARRAGAGFEALLDERLFTPLGMQGAYLDRRPEGVRAVQGHTPNGRDTPAWRFKPDVGGVGGVRATLDDMVRYVQGQLGDAPAPLQVAIDRAQRPVEAQGAPAMAMNWMLAPLDGRRLHVHEGGTGGFSSFVAFDREAGRGAIVLSDTALHSLGGVGGFGLHLLDPRLPAGQPRKAVAPSDELLDALAGEYRLQNGMAMTLRRRGDALEIQAQGQPPYAMGYDDAGDFYPLDFDAVLRPQRKGQGYVFTWFQMGGALPAVRTDAPTAPPLPAPDAAVLRAYTGEYPLMPGFSLKVFERDGKLFIQGTNQGALESAFAGPDVFTVEAVGAELRFERDGAGNVTAVTLHQGGQQLRGGKQ